MKQPPPIELATTPAEKRRLLHESTTGAIPIFDATTITGVGQTGRVWRVAAVFINVSQRRDVADLCRVHALESGDGDAITSWSVILAEQPLAVLNIEWTVPVTCHARLVFPFARYRPFLTYAAQTQVVSIHPYRQNRFKTELYSLLTRPSSEPLKQALMLTAHLPSSPRQTRNPR